MNVLPWIVLGIVVGGITGRFLRGNQYGIWMDVAMGIAGALLGGFLMRYSGLPGRFEIASTYFGAILGAVVLTAVTAFVNGRKRYA